MKAEWSVTGTKIHEEALACLPWYSNSIIQKTQDVFTVMQRPQYSPGADRPAQRGVGSPNEQERRTAAGLQSRDSWAGLTGEGMLFAAWNNTSFCMVLQKKHTTLLGVRRQWRESLQKVSDFALKK